MLSHAQAQAQLQQLKEVGQKTEILPKISALPANLREIAYRILGYDPQGQPLDWTKLQQSNNQVLEQIQQLNAAERLVLFQLFFPKFAATVEQAWQLFPSLPYQRGHYRRSFRIPNHAELIASNQGHWLLRLIQTLDGYDQDLPWLAAWAPYLGYFGGDGLGLLFAAAINQDDALGDQIFAILAASAQGEHEIGTMGRHVTRALLVASRPQGWELVENLLLAAQRQEGLRQVILETIDEAHPEAFRRILKLIVEQDLTRFSATVRAVDVWFGLGWESVNQHLVKEVLAQISLFLEDGQALQSALKSEEAQKVYLALWTVAFQDGFAAIPLAAQFLQHLSVEHRFVAVHLLTQLDLKEAQLALIPALEDEDLRVATRALLNFVAPNHDEVQASNLFETLEKILPRFPDKPKDLKYLVWEWINLKPAKSLVTSAMLNNLGTRSPKRLIPYLSMLEVYERQRAARLLTTIQPWDDEIRDVLFGLVGDASQWVRREVISAMSNCKIAEGEIIALEKLLTRKSADLRRGILQLILNQNSEYILNSCQRLLASKTALQRQAGLELLREMKASNRCMEQCYNYAQIYQSQRKNITESESKLLEFILQTERKEASLEDALGLINLNELTPYIELKIEGNYPFSTVATKNCLRSLDELIEQHKYSPITLQSSNNTEEELLGNCHWFSEPDAHKSLAENLPNFPLSELWQQWEATRAENLRDRDNLELVRSLASLYVRFIEPSGFGSSSRLNTCDWLKSAQKILFVDTSKLNYPRLMRAILSWLIYLSPPSNIIDLLLDSMAQTLIFISKQPSEPFMPGWEIADSLLGWLQLAVYYRSLSLAQWNERQHLRYWQLMRTIVHSPILAHSRRGNYLEDLAIVYHLGEATEADIIAHLLADNPLKTAHGALNPFEAVVAQISPQLFNQATRPKRNFHDLALLSSRKLPPNIDPILKALGDRCRQRILEVELQRGDLATAATEPALALRSVEGIDILIKLLQALSQEKLIRGYNYNNTSKSAVFSHLIRVSFPAATETPQDFAEQIKATKIAEKQLLELAFYAPQWSNYVEYALGWNHFTEGVWWIHAHTKDNNWYVDAEVREGWKVQISEKTPLSDQNLVDGAVDVDWFCRIYPDLEGERWQKLSEAAKYAAGGAGHKRAQLFAEAMLGQVERSTLIDRITQKRNQDAVRALGLLPLADEPQRQPDLLERYQILQEFLRTSRQFGSQRQANEKLAVLMAMENLARTAQYPDPQRLEWAMEARAIADLVERPQTVTLGEVTVSLALNNGQPQISVLKQGKPLKSIPAKLKKDPQILALTNRKQEITHQEKRMRLSLEQAMVRGDSFSPKELQQLCQHPILAPLLENLIFIGAEDIGYPTQQGTALRLYDHTISAIKSKSLSIAHPYQLLQTQAWHLWQEDCFNQRRSQPFKQVFRELYLLTPTEISHQTLSRRYEGHQVNPKQALALWGQRGWISCPEEGVRKTFHEADLSVWVTFQYGFYSPLEMEGLTLEGVYFTKRGDWQPLNLTDIPPTLFSEVMGDLDLVVSVAHQGGVDPEASASTVEMRTALIRESCRLLHLENVSLQGSHALIAGDLGNYSVHLGSGIVHRQPGGALCIIPVPSQHRGRLFLPFADDDPKTAEVISKVILLAKDKEIKDPTILEQIL